MRLKSLAIIAVMAGFAMTCPLAEAAAPKVDASGMAPYIYPANSPKSVNLRYMPDGLSFLKISPDRKTIVKYDVRTGKETATVMDVTHTRETTINRVGGFTMSRDGSKLLVYEDAEPIYRYSIKAAYYVFDIHRNILKPLSTEHAIQHAPVFSPDARMVAFMADDNNIYLKKLDFGTEVAVTTDGKVNSVINGVPDWTYQEEFDTRCSMTWSPDNTTLCFIKYNETDVPAYSFPLYQGACDPMDEYAYYPGAFSYKYPVAGMTNSKVSVHTYDVNNRKLKAVELPDAKIEYIPRIDFGGTAEQLLVTTLNRDQNRMEIYRVNPKSTVVKSIYVDESQAWVAPACYEKTVFGDNSFVIFSDRSGYSQLYRYSYSGNLMGQLTSGSFDVTAYYGTGADGSVYYQSTGGNPLNRVVSMVDRKGRTVALSPAEGTASAVFSPAMNYYSLTYSNVTEPPVQTLYTAVGKKVRVLEDNAQYRSSLPRISAKEFFKFTSGGQELNGYIIKPHDFSASKKYPVVMSQYSGPGSQSVLNRWSLDWEQYFASNGYVIVCVDGRGTGGRGRAFMDVVYKRLGQYETEDQVAAARYVASLPFVDASRIGIYGWSYGGYEALMAASAADCPYAAAVAIAPVTDWRYYDTVYAERYMTTPQQNADGYNAGSPLRRAGAMNCRLLIMSGTADDNVHMSNTIEYVSALQSRGILFDMMVFPNMNHSINGCNARSVVYGKMLDFFNRNM